MKPIKILIFLVFSRSVFQSLYVKICEKYILEYIICFFDYLCSKIFIHLKIKSNGPP